MSLCLLAATVCLRIACSPLCSPLCCSQSALEVFPEVHTLLRRDLGSARVYFADTCDMYSLMDVVKAASGDFVRPLEAAIGSLKALAELKSVVRAVLLLQVPSPEHQQACLPV